jgi:hypothetical protein
MASREDRSRTLVQAEPIRTTATRAANAVKVRGLPEFKSPGLRSLAHGSDHLGLQMGQYWYEL